MWVGEGRRQASGEGNAEACLLEVGLGKLLGISGIYGSVNILGSSGTDEGGSSRWEEP